MKKIFLLIAVVLAFAAEKATAQQQQPIRFGIKAGLNLSQWEGETVNSAQSLIDFTNGSVSRKMREGFHVGGYVTIPVMPGFEIEPGLLYSQKGTKLIGTIPNESGAVLNILNPRATITNKAEYIDLPIMAKVYIGEGFHVFGGPQVSYLVSNKIKAEAGALGFNVLNREFDATEQFNEFDLGLAGGLGYRFANGFNMSASYDYGLQPIDKNGSFETFNRTIKASVGYTF